MSRGLGDVYKRQVSLSVFIIIRYYVTITDINKYDMITEKVVG